jgi:hypothetical protein
VNYFEKRAIYLLNPYAYLDTIPSQMEREKTKFLLMPTIFDFIVFPIGVLCLVTNQEAANGGLVKKGEECTLKASSVATNCGGTTARKERRLPSTGTTSKPPRKSLKTIKKGDDKE